MALFPPRNPLLRQPSHLARINERHWLARDLLFVHSGTRAFVAGRPMQDDESVPWGYGAAGNSNPALDHCPGVWAGESSRTYLLGFNQVEPVTLSTWWYTTNTTGAEASILLRPSGAGGASLGRSSSNAWANAHTGATSSNITTAANYAAGRWVHVLCSFRAAADRSIYGNGINATTSTASRPLPSTCDRVQIGGTTYTSASILPMVIGGAWDIELARRLHEEQRSNPWSLFVEKRIWVPVSAAGGGTAAITAAAGAATASQLTGSSTAESAISSAAGAATASALVGKATSVAEISGATGAATASQLTGSSTARASFGAGAGVATASQLPGTSTARADFGAAAGVATGETLVGSSGSSAITVAAGVATAAALVGKSTARADFGVAAGAATASEMAGTTGSYAIDPASGMASAAVLAGSSIAVASFTPAAGVATAATMAGPSSTTVYFWRRTA